jgi:cytochrome c-type biogenesis protein CcmE
MKRKHQRLVFFLICAALVSGAAALVLSAFDKNLVYFYTPSDIVKSPPSYEQKVRVGGLVVAGSIKSYGAQDIEFTVTDNQNTLRIFYKGILPSLFREGQGVIAEGYLEGNDRLQASQILAKHDENYMPPEIAEALKKSGHWKDQYPKHTQ